MVNASEIKPKEVRITTENLRFVAGLNGYTGDRSGPLLMDCSDTLLYQAALLPDSYPQVYSRLCVLCPGGLCDQRHRPEPASNFWRCMSLTHCRIRRLPGRNLLETLDEVLPSGDPVRQQDSFDAPAHGCV